MQKLPNNKIKQEIGSYPLEIKLKILSNFSEFFYFTIEELTLIVDYYDTIQNIKNKIKEIKYFDTNSFSLYHNINGFLDDNNERVLDSRIDALPIIFLIFNSEKKIDMNMQIYIKTLIGKTITIDAKPFYNILQIKVLFYNKEGIPIDQQKLIFNGKLLENKKTLNDCGIKKESTLHLVQTLRGGKKESFKKFI